MFPFPEVAVTATGIQGARHSAPFGISLPDISLFNRPGGGHHHLLNSIGMAHQLGSGPRHFTVPSPTATPMKARDTVSCLLTLGKFGWMNWSKVSVWINNITNNM